MTLLGTVSEKIRFNAFATISLLVLSSTTFAAPNILFIISDDLSTDFSTYGVEHVKAPNLDALASNGIRFDRAYAQYPSCTPSRTSFLTGLYPGQTGVTRRDSHFRDFIPDVKTLPQLFRENGYFTARIGKVFHYNVPKDIGTDGLDDAPSWSETVNPIGVDRDEFDAIEYIHDLPPGSINGGMLSWLNIGESDDQHTDGKATLAAIKLLEDEHPDKTGVPFFLAVGYYRPHVPFAAPRNYFEMYPLDEIELVDYLPADREDIPIVALSDRPYEKEMSIATRKKVLQAYFASISFVDAQVGRLLANLKRLDLLDNTIIVFISDHGFLLGEHGLWQKSNLFENAGRTPMIVSVPGNPANGMATSSLVELVDIYPTLLEYAGITAPDSLAGHSLKPIIAEPAHTVRDSAFSQVWSSASRMRDEWKGRDIMGYSIRTENFRYTEWAGGVHGVELYDHRTDPREITNVAGQRDYKHTQIRLKKMLQHRIQLAGEPAQ